MSLLALDPLDSDAVKLGAGNIRTLKGVLNTLLGRFFSDTSGTVLANSVETTMLQDGSVTTAKHATPSSTSTGVTPAKIAWGTANDVLKTNNAGTATEYGKLVNANIDAAAAIAVTKLAFGTSKYLLRTNNAATANEFFTPKAVSAEITIAGGTFHSFTHGLGVAPQLVRWVLVNKVTDLGYVANDEIDVALARFGIASSVSAATSFVDTSTCQLYWPGGTGCYITPKTPAPLADINESKWVIKCYAFAF